MNHFKIESRAAKRPRDQKETGIEPAGKPYFEIVRDEIARNISEGKLRAGVVLLEGPIASLLGVSRGPVKRALELLAEDGLIRRFNGRGYLVGAGDDAIPNRVNLLTLDLRVSGEIQAYAQRATWQKIYQEVAESVAACTPFGAYQLSESAMCAHFEVSRTVVRDVLARLNHDGLVEKDRWSHWTVGPLTARDVQEHYEMRLLLEPAALRLSAPSLPRADIEAMICRVRGVRASGDARPANALDAIESDLHQLCLAPLSNRRLVAAIVRSRSPDVINKVFARHFGLHDIEATLDEHERVYADLLQGSAQGAALALEQHLSAALERTRARLKVLSVLSARETASYLKPLAEERGATAKRAGRRIKPARRRPVLRVLGRREILLQPIRQQAVRDLGFEIAFELVDGDEEIRQAVTRPESFDVYHQWHTVDLLWTAASIQPIEIARIERWPEIETLANDGASACDDLFRQLYVQHDRRLAAQRTSLAAMLPVIHGADSLGYLPALRERLAPGELDSWRWLIDERWRGKVAMLRDPTLGMIEAALALEGAGILKFGNIANPLDRGDRRGDRDPEGEETRRPFPRTLGDVRGRGQIDGARRGRRAEHLLAGHHQAAAQRAQRRKRHSSGGDARLAFRSLPVRPRLPATRWTPPTPISTGGWKARRERSSRVRATMSQRPKRRAGGCLRRSGITGTKASLRARIWQTRSAKSASTPARYGTAAPTPSACRAVRVWNTIMDDHNYLGAALERVPRRLRRMS